MPQTEVVYYCESDGSTPLIQWLDEQSDQVALKCVAKIERLAECGHELRRPEADFLRDGIYELRVKHGRVNYRMLYFFQGNVAAVVSHGCTNESVVPRVEIERAIERKARYEEDPQKHTYAE